MVVCFSNYTAYSIVYSRKSTNATAFEDISRCNVCFEEYENKDAIRCQNCNEPRIFYMDDELPGGLSDTVNISTVCMSDESDSKIDFENDDKRTENIAHHMIYLANQLLSDTTFVSDYQYSSRFCFGKTRSKQTRQLGRSVMDR